MCCERRAPGRAESDAFGWYVVVGSQSSRASRGRALLHSILCFRVTQSCVVGHSYSELDVRTR
eukprot:163739-Lingulodinium_polyedra.AAC.1